MKSVKTGNWMCPMLRKNRNIFSILFKNFLIFWGVFRNCYDAFCLNFTYLLFFLNTYIISFAVSPCICYNSYCKVNSIVEILFFHLLPKKLFKAPNNTDFFVLPKKLDSKNMRAFVKLPWCIVLLS